MTREYLELQKRSALLRQVVDARAPEPLCYQLKEFKIVWVKWSSGEGNGWLLETE